MKSEGGIFNGIYYLVLCPHAEEEWHQKLEKLVVQRRENHSSKIDQLLLEEIEEIKAENLS